MHIHSIACFKTAGILRPKPIICPSMSQADSAASSPVSFPDGDVVLRSNDGATFQVHSVVLRESSPFFRDMLQLPNAPSDGPTQDRTIPMAESSDVLNDLLQWLYPMKTAPVISSIFHAISLLRAVEKLQIESATVVGALSAYITSQSHPLRAWALAARFGYADARKLAVQKFISTDEDFIDDIPAEMAHADARGFMKLLRIKRNAIQLARGVITSEVWTCSHCASRWRPLHLARTTKSKPFVPLVTSDILLEMHVTMHGGTCCIRTLPSGIASNQLIRARLTEILASAAYSELSGDDYPSTRRSAGNPHSTVNAVPSLSVAVEEPPIAVAVTPEPEPEPEPEPALALAPEPEICVPDIVGRDVSILYHHVLTIRAIEGCTSRGVPTS